jgi:hypothetical protein
MTSATIKLYLPRGDAKSLRTAEISNWTGKAIAAPRTELDELLAREELDKAGIYILTGNDKDGLLVFGKDVEFTSPSAAAAVIHGGSANGLISWKTAEGVSLKQLDEQH